MPKIIFLIKKMRKFVRFGVYNNIINEYYINSLIINQISQHRVTQLIHQPLIIFRQEGLDFISSLMLSSRDAPGFLFRP